MPRGDGTGPAGRGPMTGRAAGYCAGYNVPGYMNFVPAGGRGRAWRRGFGGMRYAPAQQPVQPAPAYGQPQGYPQQQVYQNPEAAQKQELEYLKDTKKAMKEELNAVKDRIEEIENNLEQQ